jgi:integrase
MSGALVPLAADPMARIKSLVLDSVPSPLTKAMYGVALDRFLAWVATRRLPFTKSTVNAYRVELEASGLAPSSVNQKLSAIRKLATEAADNGLLDPHLADGVRRVRGAKRTGVRLGKWLDKKQAEDLLAAPDRHTTKGKRDRAMLALMLGGGFRRGEIASMTIGHVQTRDSRWVVVDLLGKHGRVRSVPIPNWAKSALDAWTEAAGIESGRIFRGVDKAGRVQGESLSPQAVYRVVEEYAQVVGVGVRPHDLRRSFSQLAWKGGAPIDQLQLTLGHGDIGVTQRYLGVRQSLTDAPCDRLGLCLD